MNNKSDVFAQKMTYLLNHLDCSIESFVYDVLGDSTDDPQYSAVTASNLIKCYIDVKLSLGQPPPYNSVEDYLRFNCFSEEEIQEFECKRQREATYYVGKQY